MIRWSSDNVSGDIIDLNYGCVEAILIFHDTEVHFALFALHSSLTVISNLRKIEFPEMLSKLKFIFSNIG